MDDLKLAALDAEDLTVISAHLQDSILKAGEMQFWPRDKRFVLMASRFCWECAEAGERHRRLCAVQFGRVLAVKTTGLDPRAGDRVLNLLTVTFRPAAEPPGGDILLTFSEGAALKLTVECVEAALADLGPEWDCRHAPRHLVE
jgi:hypothetical protein